MVSFCGWFILLFFGLSVFFNFIDMVSNKDEEMRYMALGRIIMLSPVLCYTYLTMFGGQ
jgi:hypothetical protein